jgi:integrase/recombinase XerD
MSNSVRGSNRRRRVLWSSSEPLRGRNWVAYLREGANRGSHPVTHLWSIPCPKKKRTTNRFQSPLAQRLRDDLILDGKRPRSIEAYLAAVGHLATHFGLSPDKLSEEQIRQYLLLRSESLKKNSLRPVLAGIKFFYRVTVPREWKTLQAMRIPKTSTVRAILVPETVWQLIEATRAFHYQVFFRTAYSCGLRPGDARHLTTSDVDAPRMLLHVRTTKGHHERSVPLPQATLDALREYWLIHRHPKWLFPSRASRANLAGAEKPMSERGIQRTFAEVVRSLGLKQKGLCPHSLRHSYATTMLEEGVNLKVLQSYLGHKTIQATEVYLHLTRHGDAVARAAVERLMNGPVENSRPQEPDCSKPGGDGETA